LGAVCCLWLQARRAAASNLVLTHSVLASPDDFMAAMIASYSSGEIRLGMNFPRFSFWEASACRR